MSGVVVLTGGVGGSKLVLGLTALPPPGEVTAIVNTGDDFRHLGLHVSPDIDTLLYTLSGKANREQGWGRQDESWSFMAAVSELGGPDWFRLGDGDMALHVLRSAALDRGDTLSAVTERFARRWQVAARVLPMSDDLVSTEVRTDEGVLPFQRYFVERRCEPAVSGIDFVGADAAGAAPGVLEAISDPTTRAILIAPSNPYLSVDPILAVPGVRVALADAPAPVIAISPIIGGRAVKGPTAKLMQELGLEVSNHTVADHYAGLIDGLLVDNADRTDLPVPAKSTDILMLTTEDKIRVARAALNLAEAVRR